MKHSTVLDESNYGISRVDDENHHTHAWRVSLRRHGKRHVKNFPDKKYGDSDRALACARDHRDELVEANPPITRAQVCEVRRSNNRSGVTGVCTYAKRYQRKNGSVREHWYWEASWPDANGEAVKKTFSVNTFGNEIARQMAIRTREEGLAKLEGVFWASQRGDIGPMPETKSISVTGSDPSRYVA